MTRPFGDKEAKRKFTQLIDDFKPDVVHLNNIHTQLSHNFLQNYGGTQKHQCRLGTVDDFISEYKRINQSPNGHLEVCLAVNFVSKAELTRIFATPNYIRTHNNIVQLIWKHSIETGLRSIRHITQFFWLSPAENLLWIPKLTIRSIDKNRH